MDAPSLLLLSLSLDRHSREVVEPVDAVGGDGGSERTPVAEGRLLRRRTPSMRSETAAPVTASCFTPGWEGERESAPRNLLYMICDVL